ncbi:hypothetical protein TIFTF001_027752 [Ficus carica]|uniref:Uncharacterized protein n=1 Tax=Ficus carica TaxID=3494 RepID=A0AA88DNS5_FICCA|nr:hypothetical protein TIFTF001_027752 [Ficus carica]
MRAGLAEDTTRKSRGLVGGLGWQLESRPGLAENTAWNSRAGIASLRSASRLVSSGLGSSLRSVSGLVSHGLTRTRRRSWAHVSGRRHVARRSWAARLGSTASCWRGSVAGSFGLHFLGFV